MSRLLPLGVFLLIFALLGFGIWYSANHNLSEVPSPLIGKPAPDYALPLLYEPDRRLGSADLAGEPYLLNVFGSWCFACRDEHPVWMEEARRLGVRLVGFNYKDEPADAVRWLAQYGDPYDVVIADYEGRTAIDFGVTGAPETFLVDADGVILYKHISPVTPEVLMREFLPRITAARGTR